MAYKKIGGVFPVTCSTTCGAGGGGSPVYEQVNTGLSITDRVGWLLKRVEDFSASSAATGVFDTANDKATYGLILSNGLGVVSLGGVLNVPQAKWVGNVTRKDVGAAASGQFSTYPQIFDYSMGGEDDGILMVPQPLYSFCLGEGLTANFTSLFRAWFQAVQLTDADYFNMLQANQMIIA